MSELDFLDGQEPATADATTPEQVVEGPARGPDGKFVSSAPEPDPQPEPEPVVAEPEPAAQPEPHTPPPGYVPVAALQALREEMRALKQPQQQHQQPEIPDPYDDPQGFAEYQAHQTQQATLNIKLDISEDLARAKHGDEPVEKARDWALSRMQQSPSFRDEVLSNRNPYEFIVQAYQRDQVVAQLTPEKLAAFEAWQAAQANPAPQPAIPPATPAPPRSIASQPSAGSAKPGEQPVGPGVAFDSVFK